MEPFNVPTIKAECAKNVLGGHFPTKHNDLTDYHFFIVEIIVESVNWHRCQNITENYYYHYGEQLGFDKKAHFKTQKKKKKECSCNIYVAGNEEFEFIWQKLYSRERQMPYSIGRKLP